MPTQQNEQPELPLAPVEIDDKTLSQLIPLVIDGPQEPRVNARDLHAFLENGDHFATWISERIKQYGFVEGQDFEGYSANAEKPQGGRPSKEYALSLGMAKELSMVERNDQGKRARRYFISCEEELKRRCLAPALDMTDPLVLAKCYVEAEEAKRAAMMKLDYVTTERNAAVVKAKTLDVQLTSEMERSDTFEARVAELEPQAETLDQLTTCRKGLYSISETAKHIDALTEQKVSRATLFAFLRWEVGVVYSSTHTTGWTPLGLFWKCPMVPVEITGTIVIIKTSGSNEERGTWVPPGVCRVG